MSLRAQYINAFNHIRMGKLLEDLDALAGNVSFLHADDGDPNTRPWNCVTASIDKLDMVGRRMNATNDVKLTGVVSYVGNSSMEIKLDAWEKNNNNDLDWQRILTSYFTMVCLDPITKLPAKVNRLKLENEEENVNWLQGEKNKEERKKANTESLKKVPPTQAELQLIHTLFLDKKKLGEAGLLKSSSMSQTKQQTLIICHPQETNIHNTIFGGYLLRLSFELAFNTCFIHAKRFPFFSSLGDVAFHKPIQVGSLLNLHSTIIYTNNNQMEVQVKAFVINPLDGTEERTNTFYYTFQTDPKLGPLERQVAPDTYSEAMSYIEGMRKLKSHDFH